MTQPAAADGLVELYASEAEADAARAIAPEYFDGVAEFWAVPYVSGELSVKDKELVALALHASPTTLHESGMRRHVRRAVDAGATDAEVAEVLALICVLGSHAFHAGMPVLLEELRNHGGEAAAELPPMPEDLERLKQDFIRDRGYWTDDREMLARLVPDFYKKYMALSYEPWRIGVLEPKTRELIYIAIDASVTHMYEFGLRLHIRNALRYGASRAEILEVFKLAATLGVSTYVEGTQLLLEGADR